jgi:hypothetical protein
MRLSPDLKIKLSTKTKKIKIDIFNCENKDTDKNEKKVRIKINNEWYKNKMVFKHNNLEKLIFNVVEQLI